MQTPQAIHVLLKNQKQFHSSRDQFLSKWVFIFPGFLTSIVNPYITYNRSNGFRSIFWLFERIWWYNTHPKERGKIDFIFHPQWCHCLHYSQVYWNNEKLQVWWWGFSKGCCTLVELYLDHFEKIIQVCPLLGLKVVIQQTTRDLSWVEIFACVRT